MMEAHSFRLSLPYNHDEHYIDEIVSPVRNVAGEVYLPVHWTACDSGRPWMGIQGKRAYYDSVAEMIETLKAWEIVPCFVANHLEDDSTWSRLVDEVLYLAERYPTACYVISSITPAIEIHRVHPALDISPSTLSDVDSPAAARYWIELVGAKTITISRKINRQPEMIRRIRRMGAEIRMVLSDDCLPACPFTSHHFASLRTADRAKRLADSIDVSALWCCRPPADRKKSEDRWLLAQSNVLPGHLHHLEGLVDLVKIAGRDRPTQMLKELIHETVEMRSLRHAFGYQEPPEAWEQLAQCDRVCEDCGWCEAHIKR